MSNLLRIGIAQQGALLNQTLDGVPSALLVDIVTSSQIDISFTIGSTNQDGHYIERSDVAGGLSGYTVIATLTGIDNTYIDTDLTQSTRYYYRVRAYLGTKYSEYCTINSGVTFATAITDVNAVAWHEPALLKQTVSGADSIYFDKLKGTATLGSEQSSGNTVLYQVYQITATTADFFYTGCQVGDIFTCPTVKTCTASNKVKPVLGNHVSQITAARRPVDGVFDGTDDIVKSVAFSYPQPITIYMVFKQLTWTNGDQIVASTALGGAAIAQGDVSPRINLNAGNVGINATSTVNELLILRAVINGANSKLQINDYPATAFDAGTKELSGLCIGGAYNATAACNMQLVEEIFKGTSVDSAVDEEATFRYLKKKHFDQLTVAITGDSTVATSSVWSPVQSFMTTNAVYYDLSHAGDTISDQLTAKATIIGYGKITDIVFIQIGLNDITADWTTLKTAYQSNITSWRNTVGNHGKIIICTLIPGRYWVDYPDSKWLLLNEAIRGEGDDAFTGADGFIDVANSVLNDGDDGLAAIYDGSENNSHENDLGRQVIAALWDAKLAELNL